MNDRLQNRAHQSACARRVAAQPRARSAASFAFAAATTSAAAVCATTTNCVVYRWNAASNRFNYAAGTWISTNINACVGSSDSVGVIMKATHRFLFGLFGTTQSMSDRAVMQFEPLPVSQCAPGAHP